MSIITQHKAGPISKKVLLFSGGMDSLMYAHLLKPDVLLYVPSNSVYSEREGMCVIKLGVDRAIAPVTWLENTLDLRRWERDDLIVPNRNAHLILLASNYGDTIYLASVSGDRSADKDEPFFQVMKVLLDHMHSAQHWTHERMFAVGSPYKHMTKRQLVSHYLSNGGESRHLLTSYSCYAGKDTHCGVCKPCARKRVALELNGVFAPENYWQTYFWQTDWWSELAPRMSVGQYRGAEDFDFMDYARRMKIKGYEDWIMPHSDSLRSVAQ